MPDMNIKTEAVFTNTEINNEHGPFGIQHPFQEVFYESNHLWKYFFGMVWSLPLRWIFSLEHKKNLHGDMCSYQMLCFIKNYWSNKIVIANQKY